MAVSIEYNDQGLEAFLNRAANSGPEIADAFRAEGSEIAVQQLRALVPIKTGFLRESIFAAFMPEGFMVGAHAPYAKFVDKGTRPHMIFPRYRPYQVPLLARSMAKIPNPVLRWYGPWGNAIFARYVHHPGFAGYHFMDKLRDFLVVELPRLAREIIERVIS